MEERYMLELRGVSRRISSEFYLRGINLALRPGEVHALVGAQRLGQKHPLFHDHGRFYARQRAGAD